MPSATLFPGAPCTGSTMRPRRASRASSPSAAGIGPAGPDEVIIAEGACRFAVALGGGHKTGFYLDQRDNRALRGGPRAAAAGCSTPSATRAPSPARRSPAGATGALLARVLGRGARGARAANLELNGLADRAELRAGQCVRRAPPARGGEGAVRPRRPRPAAVHAAQGRRRGGRARLQGDQPPRPPAPRAGRDPRDVLLLAPRHAVVLRGDLPRRRGRCAASPCGCSPP